MLLLYILYIQGYREFNFTKNKRIFRQIFHPNGFLQKDPLEWEDDNSFQIGLEIIKKLKVLNDTAERGVKLMEDYNKILSRSEEE